MSRGVSKELKEEILAMAAEDQAMRRGEWDPSVDERNTRRMKEIIDQYGWPGRSLVGEDGANQAWLLVQHADHDVDFQEQSLKLLEKAVDVGEADKKNLAYLTDRVRVHKGKPQLYGTQFYRDGDGNFGPSPIEDVGNIDKRREEVGLEPFDEYRRGMEERYGDKK